MTLERCRQNLIELLTDPDNHVIALSGKWGTGKSHLWGEVQAASKDEKIKNAVYVSLFGLSSVEELKLRIAQGVLPKLQENSPLVDSIKVGITGVKKILKSIHSGFSALDELALIAVPMLIQGRFIVIDDIERKHADLSIDEILGFIDGSVQNLECRFLLILNSDELEDKTLWDLFREKVIDQELRLDTSSSESYDIAANLTSTAFGTQIKPAVEACQITNIRVVRKIIRVVNRLLANRTELRDEMLRRVIPSTALLSAIHYKGIDDAPDLDFVLQFENSYAAARTKQTKGAGDETAETKAHERWRLLMDKLGILGTDEFEALVVNYLKSGLFEGEAVGRIIDRYSAEGRELSARNSAQAFFERSIWHPEILDPELLADLRAMLLDVPLLNMFTVTSLYNQAIRLAGGAALAQEIVDTWLAAFRAQHPAGQEEVFDPDYNSFRQPLHPAIEAAIRAIQGRQQTNVTLLQVCQKVRNDHGWGQRETNYMRSVEPRDYEAAIRSVTGGDLKLVLLQSMDFLKNRANYDPHFGGATQSFLDACRAIVLGDPNARIGRLIHDLFRDAGLEAQLIVPAAVIVPANTAPPAEIPS